MQITRTQLTTEEVLTQHEAGKALSWKAWLVSSPREWGIGKTQAQAVASLWHRHGLASQDEAKQMVEQEAQA